MFSLKKRHNNRTNRILSAVLVLVLMMSMMVTPAAFAAIDSNAHYLTLSQSQSEWLESTEMVDWNNGDAWQKQWMSWLLSEAGLPSGTTSFTQKSEAAYAVAVRYAQYNTTLMDSYVDYNGRRTQVKNITGADLADYVPQYTFSEMISQVALYASGTTSTRPLWTCGDFARLMTGLLRYQGVPAYIEIGSIPSNSRYHARVALVDTTNRRIYYSDPTYGRSSTNTDKWRWLTRSEYDDDYRQSYISNEKLPSRSPNTPNPNPNPPSRPPAENPNNPPPIVRPDRPDPVRISVPSESRWGGRDVIVPVTRNGTLIGNIPMRVIKYDGVYWFAVRDVCAVLTETTRSVNVRWDAGKGTVVFERGDYRWNGSELNWGYGRNNSGQVVWTGRYDGIAISKTAQAYLLPNAWFGTDQTNIRVISLDGDTYVRPTDIARMMNFDGSNTYEHELGANFRFN